MTTGLRRAKLSHTILSNAVERLEVEQRFLTGLSGFCGFLALLTFGYAIAFPWSFVLTALFMGVSVAALVQLGEAREDHRVMIKRLERAERKLNETTNKE